MTERELADNCIALALALGWIVSHRTSPGAGTRRSPHALRDYPGVPDLILVAGPRRAEKAPEPPQWWEIKSVGGSLSRMQIVWRDALIAAGQVWRLVRSSDYLSGRVEEWLR